MNQNLELLSMDSLPVGLRFRPTDEELIRFYLRRKINGHDDDVKAIREIDICKWEPWDLPDFSVIKTKDSEWLFFCPLDRKYPNGSRQNRGTVAGYWKATGKDRKVKSGKTEIIGVKRTLVFHSGRAPKGTRTNWIIHEYRATEMDLNGTYPGQSPFVICKLFKKQDLNLAEGDSKFDEAEPAVSSPTVADSKSEEVSVVSETKDAKRYDIAESSLVVSGECHSDACDEATTAELFDFGWSPELESLDYKVFSPLHSQVQSELGSSFNAFQSGLIDVSGNDNNINRLHIPIQYEDEVDISEFLDSILENPDGVPPEKHTIVLQNGFDGPTPDQVPPEKHTIVLQSGFDGPTPDEVPPEKHTIVLQSGFDGPTPDQIAPAYQQGSAVDMSDDVSATGIKIMTRRPQPSGCTDDYVVEGKASRRLRLQINLNDINLKNPELQADNREANDTVGETIEKGCGKLMRSKNKTSFVFKIIRTYGGLLSAAVVAVVCLMLVCSVTVDLKASAMP